ncbi:MAG TPA: hypothetical protein VGL94_08460 [Ktedonobacteraceae bacterium]|jgi:hypothetical protein
MSGFTDAFGSMITVDKIRDWLFNAQAFYGTASQESEANATVDAPCSIFNPANSGKNIFINSWIVSSGTGSLAGIMFATTADPAYASSLNIQNAKAGGAASAIVSHCSFVNTSQSEPGSGEFRRLYNDFSQEMIPNGFGILLPKGSSNGVSTFLETYASGIGSQSMAWLEF